MNLAAQIPDGAWLLIDTIPLVCLLEGNELGAPFEPLFADFDAGRLRAVVTPITLAEVACGPIKSGNEALAARYAKLLTTGQGWSLRNIDAEIAISAARLRVRYRLKLPDAFQLAVALAENCYALVTHDRDFGHVKDIAILGC